MADDSDDPTERARMDDEAFERLPPAVKLATLLERERKQKKLARNTAHSTGLGLRGALLSFVLFFTLHLLLVQNILVLALISLAGAAAGYYVVANNRGHLVAMVLFSGAAIVGDVGAFATGEIASTSMVFVFFIWLVLMAAGQGMVYWTRKHRESI